jgi:HPt (histidine-containing phosphotransfer) domain-containing protein
MMRAGPTDSPSRADAVLALRNASRAMVPHLQSDTQRADLDLIDAAIDRLARSSDSLPKGLDAFDAARLDHLLALTGPDLARELLTRLVEDLSGTATQLHDGAATGDWKRLREGTHVLISLAGSVGATSLQARAEAMNAAAHRQDTAEVATLKPDLQRELSALIAHVRSVKA